MHTPVTVAPSGPYLPAQPALRLGYLGLVPFVFGALLVWFVRPDAHPYVVDALAAYAALIVSFLGGIHWGLGYIYREPRLFAWAITAMLIAWVALLMPPYAGLVLHGVMLVACYLVDRRVYPRLGLQAWLTLRFRLSAIAALCCFLGAAGT
ncbi:DUF3429 domain-containing protein [Azohydromonas caseinilytica]|uniref:DUF3429 domain-containing protein n=1 Tax=Azohydromonas caseinilytica TaxID=2728836 RepID=A0A848F7H0_9BURK|nr:DUF3429 domain-containing protein [Azohydromonas caseinilytica]NML15108.1 DUF3429 domain-containing protein [Azohydromonas caseinilytica]